MEIAVFADKIGLVQQMLELQEDNGVSTAYVEDIVSKLASSDSANLDMMEVLIRRVKITGTFTYLIRSLFPVELEPNWPFIADSDIMRRSNGTPLLHYFAKYNIVKPVLFTALKDQLELRWEGKVPSELGEIR